MKMILTAIAFAIATPAVAQTAAADPHANHAAHATQTPVQPAPAGQQGSGQERADPHAGHAMADCCCKDGDGQMACCKDKQAQASGDSCCDGEHAEHAHADAGHAMSGNAHAGHGSNHL